MTYIRLLFSLILFFLNPLFSYGSDTFDPTAIEEKGRQLKQAIFRQIDKDSVVMSEVYKKENLERESRMYRSPQKVIFTGEEKDTKMRVEKGRDATCFNKELKIQLERKVIEICQPMAVRNICSNNLHDNKALRASWKVRLDSIKNNEVEKKKAVHNFQVFRDELINQIPTVVEQFTGCEKAMDTHFESDACLNLYNNIVNPEVIDRFSKYCTLDSIDYAVNEYIQTFLNPGLDGAVINASEAYDEMRVNGAALGEFIWKANNEILRITNPRAPATSPRPRPKPDRSSVPTS